jgi:hypothetical protein
MAFRRPGSEGTRAVVSREVNMSRRVLAVLAGLALAVPAWADGPHKTHMPKTIKVELSGYSINLNPDLTQPVVRGFIHAQGRSSLGPVSATNIGFLTGDFTFVLPEWCSGTSVVFLPAIEASSGYIGLRFDATGELLQLKQVIDDESGLCYDYMTNHYTGRAGGTVIAGTGRFHGATGTMTGNRFGGYCPEPNCAFMSPMVASFTIELEK